MYLSKRIFDLLVVFLLAPVWVPLIVGSSLCIVIFDGMNPIFLQSRVGFNGKKIKIIKLRTMVSVDTRYDEQSSAGIVLRDDPRVTKLGSFMRSLSLDEMPQFINVLLGQMSVVGPRPAMLGEMEAQGFDPQEIRKRNSVLPGLVGDAQLAGRNNLTWKEKMKLDLSFADRLQTSYSIFQDAAMVIMAILLVLSRKAIYEKEGRDRRND